MLLAVKDAASKIKQQFTMLHEDVGVVHGKK